jgi:Transposase
MAPKVKKKITTKRAGTKTRKRRSYTDAFKMDAVRRVTAGRTIAQVARSLSVPESALRLWVASGGGGGGGAVGLSGGVQGRQMFFLQRASDGGLWSDLGSFSTREQVINAIRLATRKDPALKLTDLRVYAGWAESVMPGLAPMVTATRGRLRGRIIKEAAGITAELAHTNGHGRRRSRAKQPELNA